MGLADGKLMGERVIWVRIAAEGSPPWDAQRICLDVMPWGGGGWVFGRSSVSCYERAVSLYWDISWGGKEALQLGMNAAAFEM